ncbi:thymidine phosphorylase [Syntrophobotulus glycolicus DSM 8271]|uniref:Pyrimidine-nucleoside phosphorylase n=1 Tax=Syntrophobotulus glycolicus (strain DSM 8271 / FlGlyR) TaxID=645991 RepID=F0T078_SYNGF|nr:thymidine phosphorylase [Syntrophobotulus glycolicus]ADY56165.1 thymidine phosphorylase [Syntrophobotulus glycolicus DSM 8271]
MRMVDLIEKKRNGQLLNKEEIQFIIRGYVSGDIPDYQISAWLMAIYFQGMLAEETAELTLAMAQSGKQIDLGKYGLHCIDKHSTGGVGDKTTLIVAPLVAACGVKIAKMSGRGLGFTGGTIDKLEAIPGFHTELSEEAFLKQVADIGLAVTAQSADIVPADKKLYALRDVTGTVNSIPLIASSVMSKKIAAGAQGIVLDVKYGSGAFMPDIEQARTLAEIMVDIGNKLERKTIAILSDMNQPLGNAVGNSLEILEVVDSLQGTGPADLLEVCLLLGSWMLIAAGKTDCVGEGKRLLQKALDSGAAWQKFCQLISAQKGDLLKVQNKELFLAPYVKTYQAPEDAFIQNIDAGLVGRAAMMLGAGRETKESTIDFGAGLVILKKTGEKVLTGESLLKIYTSDAQKAESSMDILRKALVLGQERPVLPMANTIVVQ